MTSLPAAPSFAACALCLACGCHLLEPRASYDAEPAPTPSSSAPGIAPDPVVLPALPDAGTEAPPQAAEPVPPGVVQAGGPTRGTLPKAAVNAEMERAMPAFRNCYESALRDEPALRGTVFVHFVVAPDGSVPYAAPYEAGTDLDHEGVIDCVLAELQKLRFPAPSGGRAVVSYPIQFEPAPPRSPP